MIYMVQPYEIKIISFFSFLLFTNFFLLFLKMVQSLKKYIISTNKKSGATNKLCYCKACYNKLGEDHPDLKTIADKTDRILKHFKSCQNFQDLYSQQEKDEVFKSKEES